MSRIAVPAAVRRPVVPAAMRRIALIAAVALAGCAKPAASVVDPDAVAAAAAERKAVADTDAARRDATSPAEPKVSVPG